VHLELISRSQRVVATSRRRVILAGLLTLLLDRLVAAEERNRPTVIALPDFVAAAPRDQEIARALPRLIAEDLARGGRFAPTNPAIAVTNADATPAFEPWRAVGAEAVVIGRVFQMPDGRQTTQFRLWDVAAGRQLSGQQYVHAPENSTVVAHIMADAIHLQLTGEQSHFAPDNP